MLVLSEIFPLALRPISKSDGSFKVLDLSLSISTLWDLLTAELRTGCQFQRLSWSLLATGKTLPRGKVESLSGGWGRQRSLSIGQSHVLRNEET